MPPQDVNAIDKTNSMKTQQKFTHIDNAIYDYCRCGSLVHLNAF